MSNTKSEKIGGDGVGAIIRGTIVIKVCIQSYITQSWPNALNSTRIRCPLSLSSNN